MRRSEPGARPARRDGYLRRLMTGAGTTSARGGGGGDTQSWHRPSMPASTIGPWLPDGELGESLADGLARVEDALTTSVMS